MPRAVTIRQADVERAAGRCLDRALDSGKKLYLNLEGGNLKVSGKEGRAVVMIVDGGVPVGRVSYEEAVRGVIGALETMGVRIA